MRRPGSGSASASILLLLLVGLLGACDRGLDHEKAREFLERYRLAYNSHDLRSFSDLYAPQGSFMVPPLNYPVATRELLREKLDVIWRRMPDARITEIDELVVGEHRLAFKWVISFTGRVPPGPSYFVGATFMDVEDGRIIREVPVFQRITPAQR